MSLTPPPRAIEDCLTSHFRSGDRIRSRSVSDTVLSAVLDVPVPPPRIVADWDREIASRLFLDPGDVEPMPLARTRARWQDYPRCVQAMREWTHALGLPGILDGSEMALMACRGARYHHDGAHYGDKAFCNLFLSEDKGLDVHFPAMGRRIPLTRGTALIFDTGQPHGVVRRGGDAFDMADFASGRDATQLFLSWELPVEDADLGSALGIVFDLISRLSPLPASADEEGILLNGEPALVCPDSGLWRR
ncbi:hypothetical protein OVY01_01510 [Robbsia sp. Bb-Pol-6]|uniref:Aspartyl/asparaginy/proline hydroxylase domain-containing protein n=1 Tax=Robbsia betulipollinis TaxID=2981849 RepID=A0ABT3ZHD6_9BURK|nr:hypothetical protein [Robbsia betulipollinis]MCY0385939.1 hypothetical protein [Robbsia betulipollinis]